MLSCVRKKEENKKKKKGVRRKNQVEDGGKIGGRGTGLKLVMKILRVKHARIIVSGDKNVPLFLFFSLAPFFFYLAFFSFLFSFPSLWHTPHINLYVVCVLDDKICLLFAVWLFLLKRKRRFLCAMCLYVHGHYYFS